MTVLTGSELLQQPQANNATYVPQPNQTAGLTSNPGSGDSPKALTVQQFAALIAPQQYQAQQQPGVNNFATPAPAPNQPWYTDPGAVYGSSGASPGHTQNTGSPGFWVPRGTGGSDSTTADTGPNSLLNNPPPIQDGPNASPNQKQLAEMKTQADIKNSSNSQLDRWTPSGSSGIDANGYPVLDAGNNFTHGGAFGLSGGGMPIGGQNGMAPWDSSQGGGSLQPWSTAFDPGLSGLSSTPSPYSFAPNGGNGSLGAVYGGYASDSVGGTSSSGSDFAGGSSGN